MQTQTGSRLLLAAFFVVAYAVYAPTFSLPWIYDDIGVIVENPDVQSLAGFFRDGYPGRPLRELTFLLDHAFFGLEPAGWHVQHLFWHGLNGLLVFLLGRRLTGSGVAGTVAALLFLVHPLQVEVVANLSHRKDSLALCFMLASLLAYMRSCDAGTAAWRWRLAALAWGGVALLAKQNAAVTPLLWVGYELFALPAERRWLLRRPRWAWVALVLLGAGLGVWLAALGGGELYREPLPGLMAKMNKSFTGALLPYWLLLLKGWSWIFLRLVWPVDLAVEYTFAAPAGWGDPWVLATLGLSGASVALAIAAWRRGWPVVGMALFWFWLLWLPTSNLWPLSYFAADRYLYAPSVGFCLLLGWGGGALVARWRPAGLALAVLVLLLAVLSWRQCGVWQSTFTLWSRAVAVNPASTTALNNLGQVHLERGELDVARDLFQRAVANMNDPLPYYNLGQVYERQGNHERALYYYRFFLAFDDPRYPRQTAAVRLRLQGTHGRGER